MLVSTLVASQRWLRISGIPAKVCLGLEEALQGRNAQIEFHSTWIEGAFYDLSHMALVLLDKLADTYESDLERRVDFPYHEPLYRNNMRSKAEARRRWALKLWNALDSARSTGCGWSRWR